MYQIRLLKEASQNLKDLDKTVARRIIRKLSWLSKNVENIQHKGLRADLATFSKLREGDYRIIYQTLKDERIIIVYFIGHRRDIYKAR